MSDGMNVAYNGHRKEIDACEACGASKRSLRTIRMADDERRPQLLCRECFIDAVHADQVSPLDPRLPVEST